MGVEGMTGGYDTQRLRIFDEAKQAELTRAHLDDDPGAQSMVAATTTVTTYPTTAGAFYACVPQGVLGTETESGAGTITARSGRFYALNLGTAIPPSGTNILVTFVNHRWVFRYG